MKNAFREALTALLPVAEDTLQRHFQTMKAADWTPVAELFAARLPEFDTVIALPDAESLGEQVARMRGVPLLQVVREESGVSLDGGAVLTTPAEAVLLTAHLGSSDEELSALAQAKAQGLRVSVIGAAVERTSLGGRQRLKLEGVTVRATLQLADTPQGLNLERRTPDRWLGSL